MKKFIAAIGLVASLGFAGAASAAAPTHTYSCGFTYDVKGGGFQIGLGYFKLKGTGKITCIDAHGGKTVRDALVVIGGSPVAPRVAIGYLHLHGATASFGFNGTIDDLYGSYIMAGAKAAVGIGTGASFTVQSPRHGIRVAVGVEGNYGLGEDAGVEMMTLEHPAGDNICDHHTCPTQQHQHHHHNQQHADEHQADL